MISFVIKAKFADLSGNVSLSRGKKGRTQEASADSSPANRSEGNRFNHFMKHQHPKTASAILYPIHIISDLGHMAVPQCIMGQVKREEGEEDGGLLLCSREEET